MLEPVNEGRGTVADIPPLAVQAVGMHDRDNLVIGLPVVDHPETPDGNGADNDIAVRNGFFG